MVTFTRKEKSAYFSLDQQSDSFTISKNAVSELFRTMNFMGDLGEVEDV